jgi:lysophospholipase L1-like esterase
MLTRSFQFGHNDQKVAANISLAQYQANLQTMTEQVKAAGGTPVSIL